ncbi:MAG: VCBS repeat-containing protein [Oscillatoriales cyanobacterium SM2_1_8]|nr:VCBS repeat-containing protein [Oscillatoriales cyanobacterium SM2_1_8]
MPISPIALNRWEFATSAPQTQITSIVPVGDLRQDGSEGLAIAIRSISAVGGRTVVFSGFPTTAATPPAGDWKIDLALAQPIPRDSFGRPQYESSSPSFQLIGDVNGDGWQDFVISPSTVSPPGQASYVWFNPPGGLSLGNLPANPGRLNGSTGFSLPGLVATDFAGDVNGDGLADLAVNTATGSYVVFGRRQGLPGAIDPEGLDGSNGFRIPGHTVVGGGGDLNGDGRSELFLGSDRGDWILFSQSSYPAAMDSGRLTPVMVPPSRSRTYPALGFLEDLNQDGLDELVVVEELESTILGQESHIFYGQTEWLSQIEIAQADFFLSGAVQDRFDFNGDGRIDLLSHSTPLAPCGRCPRVTDSFLTLGQPEGWRSPEEGFPVPGFYNLGRTLGIQTGAQNMGDFNGDGLADILVYDLSSDNDTTRNQNQVLFGGSLLPDRNGVVVGTPDSLPLGSIVLKPAGDVNGDGFADLVGGNYVFLGQGDRPALTVNGGVYHHLAFPQVGATPRDRLEFAARGDRPDWVYGGLGNDTLIGASGQMDQFTGAPAPIVLF